MLLSEQKLTIQIADINRIKIYLWSKTHVQDGNKMNNQDSQSWISHKDLEIVWAIRWE